VPSLPPVAFHRAALQTVSSSVADVLCKILPAPVCALFPPAAGNAQLCSLFAGNQQCANLLEQMVCAVTCDPGTVQGR